jgi:hypothetical protein
MTEQILSILSAIVVFAAAAMRMNLFKLERGQRIPVRHLLEVAGLVILMGGCAGVIGEWFLPNENFYSDTLVLVGSAFFVLGVSGGRLCQVVTRLEGCDGRDRRSQAR